MTTELRRSSIAMSGTVCQVIGWLLLSEPRGRGRRGTRVELAGL